MPQLDYQQIIGSFNFTNSSALPNTYVTQEEDEKYQFRYNFLIDKNSILLLDQDNDGESDYDILKAGEADLPENQSLEYDTFSAATNVQKDTANIILGSSAIYDYSYAAFFEDVANINFSLSAPQGAHISIAQSNWSDGNPFTFDDNKVSAYTKTYDQSGLSEFNQMFPSYDYSLVYGEGSHGDIWLNSDFINGWQSANPSSSQFWVIMHEIGHALGLEHTSQSPSIDNQKYSIMSYALLGGMNLSGYSNDVYASSLQILDIAAIQFLYGANFETRSEDGTPYTFGAGQAFGQTSNDPFLYTIWDGGGENDFISANGYSDGVKIDLREGYFSSLGKAADSSYAGLRGTGLVDDNVAIAYGTVIENAYGSTHADTIIGNDAANFIDGGGGADTLIGGWGNDTFIVTSNNTDIYGVANSDYETAADYTNIGGANNGSFTSERGVIEYIPDGEDFDTLDLSAFGSAYVSPLGGEYSVDGGYTSNELDNVENFILTNGNDYIDHFDEYHEITRSFAYHEFDGGNGFDEAFMDGLVTSDGIYGRNSFAKNFEKYGEDIVSLDLGYTYGFDYYYGVDYLPTLVDYSQIQNALTFDLRDGFGEVTDGYDTDYGVFSAIGTDYGDTITIDGVDKYPNHYPYDIYDGKKVFWSGTGDDVVYIRDTGSDQQLLSYVYTGGDDIINQPHTKELFTYDNYQYLDYAPKLNVYLGKGITASDLSFSEVDQGLVDYLHLPTSDGAQYTISTPLQYVDLILNIEGHGSITFQRWTKSLRPDLNNPTEEYWHYDNMSSVNILFADGSYLEDFYTIPYLPEEDNRIPAFDINATNFSFTQGGEVLTDRLYSGDQNVISSQYDDTNLVGTNVKGLAGNDVITGTGSGGLGDDTIIHSGFVYSQFDYNIAVSSGDWGDDTLYGGYGNDTLLGGFGNDILFGLGGDDRLLGDAGNDFLQGGYGHDRAFGGIGDDYYKYDPGEGSFIISDQRDNDVLDLSAISFGDVTYVQSGSDLLLNINGGGQVTILDQMRAVNDPDAAPINTFKVGAQTFSFQQFLDYDLLSNASSNIVGTNTADNIYGTSGDDILIGGGGDDTIYGLEGSDTYLYSLGDGSDQITDTDGADDLIKLGAGITYTDVTVTEINSFDLQVAFAGVSDTITIINHRNPGLTNTVERLVFNDGRELSLVVEDVVGTEFDDTLAGTNFSELITGLDGDDIITAGDGDDTLVGGQGDDVIDGEDGTDTADYSSSEARLIADLSLGSVIDGFGSLDTLSNIENITGTDASDVIIGDDENNTLVGGLGNDEIDGGLGDDVIDAGDGSDILTGGAGDDTIDGGAGDDAFAYVLADNTNAIDAYDGDAGTDRIRFYFTAAEYTSAVQTELQAYNTHLASNADPLSTSGSAYTFSNLGVSLSDFEEMEVYVDGGIDTSYYTAITLGSSNGTYIVTNGSANADVINGSNANGTGDQIQGYEGNDLIYGNNGEDYIRGNEGNDTIYGGGYNDLLYGDSNVLTVTYGGNDIIYGEDGADTIRGGKGDDHIEGGASADLIKGDLGDDIIFGDDGADILYGDEQFTTSGGGNDIIYGGIGNDTLDGESGHDHLYGETHNDTLRGGEGMEYLDGGDGTDLIYGEGGKDRIYGGGGNDNLQGGDDGDFLNGGAGFDRLFGQDGNDTLYADEGWDYLDGGAGMDTFVFLDMNDFAGDQYNRIKNFDANDDAINIANILHTNYDPMADLLSDFVNVVDNGSHTYIQIDEDGTGTSSAMTYVAMIEGYTNHGHDAQDMIGNGYLII